VASRFYRWRQQGIFERLLAEIHQRADACGELGWLVHSVDGSVVGAHQHAAGARTSPGRTGKGMAHPQDAALGTSRGGLSTKLHLRTDGVAGRRWCWPPRDSVMRSPSCSGCWTAGRSSGPGRMGGQVEGSRASGPPG
jgi:hypothetical protein